AIPVTGSELAPRAVPCEVARDKTCGHTAKDGGRTRKDRGQDGIDACGHLVRTTLWGAEDGPQGPPAGPRPVLAPALEFVGKILTSSPGSVGVSCDELHLWRTQ